ncbi:ATP-grasp domain-containing protein [Ruania suaedae]|uniref:ATP-grasp domain-containing protein n=1 Tax=Ruania suaedae TaxID=2897774 RepID=UPI001E41DB3A|nr:ATP-grasp domain-containing protein [Ruania suaedae]UFU02203.1 ATP-grasp domain-containing protein [Ruania suaedae]
MPRESSGSKPASLRSARNYLRKRGIHTGLTNSLLADRAMARGIELHPDSQQRLTMTLGGTLRRFNGAQTNLNGALARRCALHKDITSRLLRSYGLRAPENAVFSAGEAERAWAWAEAIAPVVVKPNSGGSGELVHLNIDDRDAFHAAFTAVSDQAREVLVEQFVDGEEHRVLMVYGKVAAAARRLPANVIGDGRHTVEHLITAKNRARVRSKNPTHFELVIDELTHRELARQQLTLESVPPAGERVWLRSNSNVHSGGDGVDATDELLPDEIELAERAVRAIPGLRLAGLDMLLPRGGRGSAPSILEINSSPMISGHHFPWEGQERDVAGMLIDAMSGAGRTTS